jgi:hypothetical protein
MATACLVQAVSLPFGPQPVLVQLCRCLLAAAGLEQAVSLPLGRSQFEAGCVVASGRSRFCAGRVVATWPQPV